MSLLTRISRGKLVRPIRLLVHGPGGVGKSTFAAGAPDPLFIDTERRTEHLNVKRFEPETWSEVMPFIGEVLSTRACKTLVLDTLDHLEIMLWTHLCKTRGVQSIEDIGGGFGKGFLIALAEFQRLAAGLEALRNAGISTILLAHSATKMYKNPTGDDYEQYAIKLDKRARALFVEKCDAVGFATWGDFAKLKKGEARAKAVTTGERVLKFEHHPAFESKAGFPLPDECPLTWEAFSKYLPSSINQENA